MSKQCLIIVRKFSKRFDKFSRYVLTSFFFVQSVYVLTTYHLPAISCNYFYNLTINSVPKQIVFYPQNLHYNLTRLSLFNLTTYISAISHTYIYTLTINSVPKGSSMSFYPDFILILSSFYPDFILILSRLYPDFIQIF